MNLAEIAVKRPSLIVVIFAVLGFLGILCYQFLSYELMPKFSMNVITIGTIYPGASPSEVENSVTKKIEDALSLVENVDNIKATSQEGFSLVIAELKMGASVDVAVQDAQRRVNAILSKLPDDVDPPTISKLSFSEFPIIRMGVNANVEPTVLYDIVKQRIQPNLSRLGGIGQITLVGGQEREIKVNLDATKMEAYKVSFLQVVNVIKNSNMDFPTGKVKGDENQNIIRLAGKFKSLHDLEELVISSNKSGSPVKLKEIAEIQDTEKDLTTLTRIDGQNSIGIMIQKQSDANAVKVKELVMKELKKLEDQYSDIGLQFKIAQDTTEFTMQAADAVMEDLMLAIILVAAVMLLFLHSLRNAVIVMIAIPASLISTFTAMYLLGFSLNLMTLLALSLVVGILVDDSIVVLENIYRHLEMGKDSRTAALDGRKEIGFTAISITLVDVVVFLPIALVEGIISNIMRQFSLVVVVSTLLSLFVSFTITPLLASRFSKVEHLNPKSFFGAILTWFERSLDRLTASYVKLLKIALHNKIVTLGLTIALFFGSFMLVGYGFIGGEFVAMGDRGEFILSVELPKDATIEQTTQVVQQIEKKLFEKEEVISIFTTIGTNSKISGSQAAAYIAEINVKLVDKSERKVKADIYAIQARNYLNEHITGAKIQVGIVGFTGNAQDDPVQFIFSGNDLDSLIMYANKVIEGSRDIKGVSDMRLSVDDGNPELNVNINKERMAELGLSFDMVGGVMRTAFNGNNDSKYKDGDYEYDINVLYDNFNRKNIDDVSNLSFVNNKGELIKLEQFADITQETGPDKLERRARTPAVVLQSQVVGRPSGTVGDEIKKVIKDLEIPSNINVAVDGELKRQGEAMGGLGFALIASILFVYLIMVALYDSYIYPFVVLFSIPVAVIGALLALALTMSTLNIFSMLGMIMLVGLVAKNAILLVDFTNQLKKEGYKTYDALLESGKTRLRPILMTTVAMVIGMLPIALATGAGAEWKNGLAWALIGGLTSSMLLTLLVVPVIYTIVDKTIELVTRFTTRRNNKKVSTPQHEPELVS